MNKQRVYFVSNSPFDKYTGVTINPSFLFLKTYYDMKGAGAVEWLSWDAVLIDTEEEQLQRILDAKPDVLALAMFIWNDKRNFRIAQEVKRQLPNTTIFMGGPQLRAHKDTDFFKKYLFVDYVCYGDGEKAFQLLIDRLAGILPAHEPLVNIVENDSGFTLVHPYEFFSDEDYWAVSPYVSNKEWVHKCIAQIEEAGFDSSRIQFAVEFARGCMYKCSFCDWGQNLSKKVKRRTHDWKEELQFFFDLNLAIIETDANFGQWAQDIEIFDHALKLRTDNPGTHFRLGIMNTSKLKKDATYHIMLNQTLHFDFPVILSVQDINTDVLQMIDRPSISYEQTVGLIKKFKENLPPEKHYLVAWTHIICGLPGQTFQRISDMARRLIKDGINGSYLEMQFWAYLENAPAAEPLYQALHGLKWIDVHGFHINNTMLVNADELVRTASSLEEIYEKIDSGNYDETKVYSFKSIKQTKYMSFEEVIGAKLLSLNIRRYHNSNIKLHDLSSEEELDSVFNMLEAQTKVNAREYIEQNQPLIDKYGFAVLVYKDGDSFRIIEY